MPKKLLKPIIKTDKKLDIILENVGDMALKRRARLMIEGLELKIGDKILDVGCGDAFYLHLLSNLGGDLKLAGCDIDTVALKSAKQNLKGKNIQFKEADLMKKIPYVSNTFDKVVMSEVAEHLPNDVKGLKEIYRVLKPGGILVLSVPNKNYPLFWDPVNWILERTTGNHVKNGFWAGIWYNHIRLYKPEQIKKAVEKAGFKVEQVRAVTWWCLPFNHNLINLMARLLYGGSLSPEIAKSVSKYEKSVKRPMMIEVLFKIVNIFDRVNEVFHLKNIGAGVFVKAVK